MEENYKKSLQMIKLLKIKTKREYERLLDNYILLSVESLKYIAETRNFKDIIKLAREAREAWKGFLLNCKGKYYISTIVNKMYAIRESKTYYKWRGGKWE